MRFLTENFSRLQGLRLLPFGFLFLAKSFFAGPVLDSVVFWIILILSLGFYYLIGLYYKRSFGQVRRKSQSWIKECLAALVLTLAIVSAIWLESHFRLPVSLLGLVVATLFIYVHISSSGRRLYYAVVAGLFVAMSLLPLIGWAQTEDIFGAGGSLGDLVLGLTYLAVGVLDHMLLARGLKPLPEENDDHAI